MVKRLCLSDPASKWHGWDSSQGLSASLAAPWFGEGHVGVDGSWTIRRGGKTPLSRDWGTDPGPGQAKENKKREGSC